MADTGWKSPSTNGTPATYDGSATEYTNPANAYSSNDSYATVVDNEATYKFQSYGGFGFTLGAGDTILGIEVTQEGKYSAAGAKNSAVYLYNSNSGNYWTFESYFTTTEQTFTYGGPTELFGFTWTYTDFTDANFHVLARTGGNNDGNTTSLDHIQVKVYYELATPSPSVSDSETISEVVTITVSSPNTSISDSIQITENISGFTDKYFLNISDSVQITENDEPTNIFGVRTVTENQAIQETITIDTIKYSFIGRPRGRTQRLGT